MTKGIVSAAGVPFVTIERIRQDVCKIGVVFFDGQSPLDITGVGFELVILGGNYTIIRKTNEQLIRTATNRIEVELTPADKAKLPGVRYQIQLSRTSQHLTELVGDLVFVRGNSSQATGLQTPPDILLRYLAGQPDAEATILVVQGPEGNITPALELLYSNTVTARDVATGASQQASTKAGEALASKGIATTKAGEALASANAAAGSATTASTKAGEAAGSATTANTKAGEAAGSASTASTKAGEALASKNDAAASANAALQSMISSANTPITMALIFG